MNNTKRLYWLVQFLGWFTYATLIFLATFLNPNAQKWYQVLGPLMLLSFFGILHTHIMRFWMIRLNWLNKKLLRLIPRLIITSIICATLIELSFSISNQLIFDATSVLDDLGRTAINILSLTFLVICWNGIYYSYHFFQKSRIQELNNIILEASKNEIELQNLRSQLNPHFLFNSLNSIRALIEIDPQKSKAAITTLSNLLRKSLISNKESLISINEEIEIVRNYLNLEKIRYEERLSVTWNIDETINHFKIPPFIIQTLVENAIKHSISNAMEGGFIKIKSIQEDKTILITVENSGHLKQESDTGIGIQNMQRRLSLLYNNRASIELKELQTSVLAILTFKI